MKEQSNGKGWLERPWVDGMNENGKRDERRVRR